MRVSTPSILLAHRNSIVLTNLADELKRRRVRADVLTARSEALFLQLQCFHPSRAVLIDLAFAQSERLLECLASDPTHPGVCVCSDAADMRALPEAARRYGCRFALAGTPVGVICDHLVSLLNAETWPAAPISPMRRENARRLLFLAGAPLCTKGGRYLLMALEMIGEDRRLLDNLTGRLFPAMALRCGETPGNIERCMRYAVDQLWRRMDQDDRQRLLPHAGARPTVRLALSAFSERLDGDGLEDACREAVSYF